MTIDNRYSNQNYLSENPEWHAEDAPWKAGNIGKILARNNINPRLLCEVGCGSGRVLAELGTRYTETRFVGFDISPDVAQFWQKYRNERIEFHNVSFLQTDMAQHYDVLILLDVLEHVPNPWEFLQGMRERADWFVFHFPLEFTAINALRKRVLSDARKKVGHIHYFNDELACCLLQECGFEVEDAFFTRAYAMAPNRSIRNRLASVPRRILGFLNPSLNARLWGGDTLVVLCRASAQ